MQPQSMPNAALTAGEREITAKHDVIIKASNFFICRSPFGIILSL